MRCELNCYGDGSRPVPLPGGDGGGVKTDDIEVCRNYCFSTSGCQAIIYGEGTCWGKKDIRTSKCQDGNGYVTEMLTEMPFGTCTLMGDPHVVTFDQRGGQASTQPMTQTDPGDYWIVTSSTLGIQGRFGYSSRFPSAASLTGIAVSGSLVQDNLLTVEYTGPEQGPSGFKVWWNHVQILNTGFPAYYKDQHGILTASFNNMNPSNFSTKARSTIGGVSGDLPSFYFMIAPGMQVYLLLGEETMNAVVTMRKLNVPMDGYCGNFNCDASDEDLEDLKARGLTTPIPTEKSYFKSEPAPLPSQIHKQGHHTPKIADCTGKLLEAAEKACAGIHPASMIEACKFDYCASGGSEDQAAQDKVASALTYSVQNWGVFRMLRFPVLENLSSGAQACVALFMTCSLVGGVAFGKMSRRRPEGDYMRVAAEALNADQADEDEEEALLGPACEHEPLLA